MNEKISGQNGNSDLITRKYFDSLLVEMRTIDSVEASTSMELFGHIFSTPVMLGALSDLGIEKLVNAAKGAKAAGTAMWMGNGPDEELEELISTGAKMIKIIKPYADKDRIFKGIEHAEKSGAIAVGIDIDYVFGAKPGKGYVEYPVGTKTLDDIKSFVKSTKLPFILKGILSEHDAKKALDSGVGAIVVSHHGGVIDYAVPPLKILPSIVKIIDKKIPIILNSGIVRGMDVFKALALGATAVLASRVTLAGLISTDRTGVQKVLTDINDELKWAMNLTGSYDINHIDTTVIWK